MASQLPPTGPPDPLDPSDPSVPSGPGPERVAAVLTALAVGFTGLTALYLVRDVPMATLFGATAVAFAVFAVRAGAPRRPMAVLVLVVAVPLLLVVTVFLLVSVFGSSEFSMSRVEPAEP